MKAATVPFTSRRTCTDQPNGGDVDMELSGKVGGGVQTATISAYGELSFVTTEDDPSVGTKLGAKWSF